MKPRVLAASSGLATWSMAADGICGKKDSKMEVKGACPLGLPPPQGERWGHSHKFQ